MNDLVKRSNGELLTNSKIVFEHFKVNGGHRYIIKKIESLIADEPEFGAQNYLLSSYTSPQNKVLKCFDMTRDGFAMIAMGLTGKKANEWKIKFINAFNQMEKGLTNIDARMNKLSIEGEEISKAGQEWSKFGHEINKRKKLHNTNVENLIGEVQGKLEF